MSDDLHEAWRHRKAGVALEPRHQEAERAYFREVAEKTTRPTLPAEVYKKAEKAAAAQGVTAPQYIRSVVHRAANGDLIEKSSHEFIVAKLDKEILRLLRLNDDFRDEMVAASERARDATTVCEAVQEARFTSFLQLISLLDFMGAPEAPPSEFLAHTDMNKAASGVSDTS